MKEKELHINIKQHQALLDVRDALNIYASEFNSKLSEDKYMSFKDCECSFEEFKDKDGIVGRYIVIRDKKTKSGYVSIPVLDIRRHSEWFWQI